MQTAMVLLFYLGLGSLTAASVDFGLAEWEMAHRPVSGYERDEDRYHQMDKSLFPENAEAPDFSLPVLDEDRSIRLSDFRGHKPVLLIFGSFG